MLPTLLGTQLQWDHILSSFFGDLSAQLSPSSWTGFFLNHPSLPHMLTVVLRAELHGQAHLKLPTISDPYSWLPMVQHNILCRGQSQDEGLYLPELKCWFLGPAA